MEKRCQNLSARKPYFFKVLMGDFKRRLRIPRAFVNHISEDSSERAILEGPSGSHWHAKLKRTTNDMYLEDGWEIFSRDHSLRGGEFVVFKYDGNMHFSVKIFATSACEREDAFTVKSSQKSVESQGKKRSGNPLKGFERKKSGRPWKSSLDPRRLSHSEKHQKDCMQEQQHPYPHGQSDSLQGRRASLPQPDRLTITAETKAREALVSFTSPFPYFVTDMKVTNVSNPFKLTIPVCFSRAYLPRTSTNMVLRNSKGDVWMVNFHIGTRQYFFSGGWAPFSRDNSLRKGDYCIFELVDELDMQVHIFQVGCLKVSCSVGRTHKSLTGKGQHFYGRRRAVSLEAEGTLS